MILTLLIIFTGRAQVYYSTSSNYLKVKTEKNNLTSNYHYAYPDTNITELNNFFPRNFMGNVGLPSPTYLFGYGTGDLGFRLFDPPLTNDRISEKQVEYYRSKGPYANLTGIAGSKLLQIFKLSFTHTYKDKINFTLKFNRYSSQGFYKNQQTYANNFYLSSNYATRSGRLGYYFYVLSNGNKNQENGGIKDVLLNDSTSGLNKSLLPIKLSGATRANREIKLMFNPWLRLNRVGDSLHGLDHYLQVKTHIGFNTFRYKDTRIYDDKFYNLYHLDTTLTLDSANLRQFSNALAYSLLSRNGNIAFSAGYKNEVSSLWQKSADVFYNHIVTSDFAYRKNLAATDSLKSRNLESAINGQYIVSGINSGNFKIESNSFFAFNARKNRLVFLDALYEKRNPDYIYNYWISNHFRWENNGCKPQEQLQLRLGSRLGKSFSAHVFYSAINHYLYFDTQALPNQYNSSIANIGVTLGYTQVFFKHLGLLLNYTYQSTSAAAYIRMPQNAGTAKLFYSGNLFKNNLQLQVGSQLQVYQGFTPYGYMPATQVFYLQDRYTTDVYPYVDVFINARIRPVAFFLKMENALGNGAAGNNYFFVPGYYQPDRAFRFGLSWTFFD